MGVATRPPEEGLQLALRLGFASIAQDEVPTPGSPPSRVDPPSPPPPVHPGQLPGLHPLPGMVGHVGAARSSSCSRASFKRPPVLPAPSGGPSPRSPTRPSPGPHRHPGGRYTAAPHSPGSAAVMPGYPALGAPPRPERSPFAGSQPRKGSAPGPPVRPHHTREPSTGLHLRHPTHAQPTPTAKDSKFGRMRSGHARPPGGDRTAPAVSPTVTVPSGTGRHRAGERGSSEARPPGGRLGEPVAEGVPASGKPPLAPPRRGHRWGIAGCGGKEHIGPSPAPPDQ